VDQSVEIGIGLAQTFDLLNGVEDGGVMLPAKNAADFR
jgi:hypothetical protein